MNRGKNELKEKVEKGEKWGKNISGGGKTNKKDLSRKGRRSKKNISSD